MYRFAVDENFSGKILKGFLRRCGDIDVVRIQDTAVAGSPDPDMLDWAAREDRLVLTHDVNTLPMHAYDRVRSGLRMPGVIVVDDWAPVGIVLDDMVILVRCSEPKEHEGQVIYIPMQPLGSAGFYVLGKAHGLRPDNADGDASAVDVDSGKEQ